MPTDKANSEPNEVAVLYYLMGEALCMIQHLEEALCHSYTLKINAKIPKSQVDALLKKNRSKTLGKAIKFAEEKGFYSRTLQNELKSVLAERNWLAHKIVPYNLDGMDETPSRERLFGRIKAISNKAQ